MSDAGDQPQPKPQILVDDDWKTQAQAEKEKMAQAEAEAAAQSAPGEAGAGGPGAQQLPPADFPSLVGMLVTQAIMYLGGVADKESGGVVFDPDLSRFYIDLLAVLEEKTKGNLSEQEAKDLSSAINELRMRFVELSQMLAKQVAEGKGVGGPGAPGMPGGPGGLGTNPIG